MWRELHGIDLSGPGWPVRSGHMSRLPRARVRHLMEQVLEAQGKALPPDDAADLREIGFRSLDFSELALRVEDELGEELNFDAPGLRRIATVADVLDFIEALQLVDG
jgi:acyl carrier protein